jgi:deoxyribonuclease-4
MNGIHIDSNIDNICNEVLRVNKLKCNLIQLFIDPMSKKLDEYVKFSLLLKKYNIKCVVHASYTINCSKEWNKTSWWIREFIMEIQLAYKIGAFGIVIHLGKQLNLSIEEGLNNMFTSLVYVSSQIENCENIKILIETSSGQGSELCYKIENFAHFYNKINQHPKISNRFGICLDTCHIFVSGHDIRSSILLIKYLELFEKLIGLSNIKLIHLNDSKNELGTKIDRHENLGYGFIGKKNIVRVIKFFKKINIPILLETPNLKQNEDIKILLSI